MKTVLITGVNGFCGKYLVRRLESENLENLYGMDISPEPINPKSLSRYFQTDITDEVKVEKIIRKVKPDSIFHLAGINQGTSKNIFSVNIMGTISVLESVRLFSPASRLIIVGSSAEYGVVPMYALPIKETQPCNPKTPYGISKYAATMTAFDYVRKYGLKIAVVRPFNIVGAGVPSNLVIGAILERIKHALKAREKNSTVDVGNLDTKRDFIAVNDVVDAYVSIIKKNCWGEIFNICSGIPRSIRSVISSLLSNSEKTISLKTSPELIRRSDVLSSYGDGNKALNTFAFKPKTNLETALKDAWDYATGGRD